MDGCSCCAEQAIWYCRNCKAFYCEKHKNKHEKIKAGTHNFETITPNLMPEHTQFEAMSINLMPEHAKIFIDDQLQKIKVMDDCTKRIIEEARRIIFKIKEACKRNLKKIEAKKIKCMQKLAMTYRQLTKQELDELELDLGIVLKCCVEIPEFKEIENHYNNPIWNECVVKNENLTLLNLLKELKIKEQLKIEEGIKLKDDLRTKEEELKKKEEELKKKEAIFKKKEEDEKIQREANNKKVTAPFPFCLTPVDGKLMQVSVGSANLIYGVMNDDTIWKRSGGSWTKIKGGLKNISVGADGEVWGVSSNDSVWRLNGSGQWDNISEHPTQRVSRRS